VHLGKTIAIGIVLFHTLAPSDCLPLWIAVSLLLTALLIYAGRARIKTLLLKNAAVFSFAAFFSLFMFFPVKKDGLKILPVFLSAFKIILVFNILAAGTSWLGKTGALFFVEMIPLLRMKLFLILLLRNLQGFKRNSNAIANQIRSRLELKGRQKLLIPKYYTRSLIMKELYAFHHHQAVIVSRLPDTIAIYSRGALETRDAALALTMICLAAASAALEAIR
jgi:hypothetical protein